MLSYADLIFRCEKILCLHTATTFSNISKLTEEVGELASETNDLIPDREALIDEIADVVICAVSQGHFVGMTAEELSEALCRKSCQGMGVEYREDMGV